MKLKKIALSLSLASMIFISACSVSKEVQTEAISTEVSVSESTEDTTQEENVTYPIVVKHAFGETVIDKKPERVASIAWSNQDTILALGVKPVGISMANYGAAEGEKLLPWTLEALQKIGADDVEIFEDTAGLDFEAINASNPDVILAAYSGITKEDYETLSKIAPVIAYPKEAWATRWREQILTNSIGMGMEEEGKKKIEELENIIKEEVQKRPQIKDKKVAFFYFNPSDFGKFYVYFPVDPRVEYLTEFGMQHADSVLELAKDKSGFALEISAEEIEKFSDVDIAVFYGNEELLEAMQKDALLSGMPAIKNGSVVILNDNSPLAASASPSALSIPYTINEYLDLIATAADKVK